MSKAELMASIDRSWAAWTTALDGIPAGRTTEPGVCGFYSVKDLIGHIAFWDERDLARAHRLASGESVQPNDWQAMNDQEYAAHKDDTLDAQMTRMTDAHARLVSDVGAFPEIEGLKLEETWPHYDEHCAEVLAWRSSEGI